MFLNSQKILNILNIYKRSLEEEQSTETTQLEIRIKKNIFYSIDS